MPRAPDKGVVGGNTSIGMNTDHLPPIHARILRHLPLAAFSDCDEQRSVRRQRQARAEVKPALDLRKLPKDDLDLFQAIVTQFSPGDDGSGAIRTGFRVRKINQTVLHEVRIDQDIEQAALAAIINVRQPANRC